MYEDAASNFDIQIVIKEKIFFSFFDEFVIVFWSSQSSGGICEFYGHVLMHFWSSFFYHGPRRYDGPCSTDGNFPPSPPSPSPDI